MQWQVHNYLNTDSVFKKKNLWFFLNAQPLWIWNETIKILIIPTELKMLHKNMEFKI